MSWIPWMLEHSTLFGLISQHQIKPVNISNSKNSLHSKYCFKRSHRESWLPFSVCKSRFRSVKGGRWRGSGTGLEGSKTALGLLPSSSYLNPYFRFTNPVQEVKVIWNNGHNQGRGEKDRGMLTIYSVSPYSIWHKTEEQNEGQNIYIGGQWEWEERERK